MTSEHYIEEKNLSIGWGRALLTVSERASDEIGPLIVSITGFNEHRAFHEIPDIRATLDATLLTNGKQSVQTVANTIFPFSMWNPNASPSQLFDRYTKILPRLMKASPKNRRGLYFQRMISGGPVGKENQLKFILDTYTARAGARRSGLQVGIFNPTLDHSASALMGFPCLQHVTFAPTNEGLCVNAMYANQYMVERAYGNYVGLCWLGRFIAQELEVPLARMTCITGIAQRDVGKSRLSAVRTAVKTAIAAEAGEGQK